MGSWQIENKDVLAWCKEYKGPKFHSLLADPPYELHFMQKSWDNSGIAFQSEVWAALSEHLLPGAFIMAFASTRGWHRMACAMEDADLIIQPSIFVNGALREVPMMLGWLNGQSFPKASRIDTKIDQAAEAKREVTGEWEGGGFAGGKFANSAKANSQATEDGYTGSGPITRPATDLARAWEGHRYGGQILKNCFEPIICARKGLTIWQSCGKLIEEVILIMEAFLCQFINAKAAEKSLKDQEPMLSEASKSSVRSSASLIQSALSQLQESGQTDMWQLSVEVSTLLNIVSLWSSILDVLWNPGRLCTTSTEIEVTTILKTLRSWLLANTSHSITEVVYHQSGLLSNVSTAAETLTDSRMKSPCIHKPSVQETALENITSSNAGGSARPAEKSFTLKPNFDASQDVIALVSALLKHKRNQVELLQLAKSAESLLESLLGQLKSSGITSAANVSVKNELSPVVVCQKPWESKRLDCIVETGAGSLWIDGGRVGTNSPIQVRGTAGLGYQGSKEQYEKGEGRLYQSQGRWPPNFCLVHVPPHICATCDGDGCDECDGTGLVGGCRRVGTKRVKGEKLRQLHHQSDSGFVDTGEDYYTVTHGSADGYEKTEAWQCCASCAARRIGEQSGVSQNGGQNATSTREHGGMFGWSRGANTRFAGDKGTAARFFPQFDWSAEIAERLANSDQVRYCSKSSRTERVAGLEALPLQERQTQGRDVVREIDRKDGKGSVPVNAQIRPVQNPHPTLKPISLCEWLCRLLLPPPEYTPRRILIPFAGVMSEAIAAMLAGWEEIVAVEMSEEYCAIGEVRLKFWSQFSSYEEAMDAARNIQHSHRKQEAQAQSGQLKLTL